MKVGLKVKCPGCQLESRFKCKKPPTRESLMLRIKCENCSSHLLTKVSRVSKDQARTQVVGIEASELLKAMIAEAIEHKKKSIEQIEQESSNAS